MSLPLTSVDLEQLLSDNLNDIEKRLHIQFISMFQFRCHNIDFGQILLNILKCSWLVCYTADRFIDYTWLTIA